MFNEDTMTKAIAELRKNLKSTNENVEKHSINLLSIKENVKVLQASVTGATKPRTEINHARDTSRLDENSGNNKGDFTELLICFDSNGKFIERKKLWKVDKSDFKRCATLHSVSQVIESGTPGHGIQYLLLNVGTNDLDNKDHVQVFDEMKFLLEQIRKKYRGIKIIVSEIIPRNDSRDQEGQAFNELLYTYAEVHSDITVACHRIFQPEVPATH